MFKIHFDNPNEFSELDGSTQSLANEVPGKLMWTSDFRGWSAFSFFFCRDNCIDGRLSEESQNTLVPFAIGKPTGKNAVLFFHSLSLFSSVWKWLEKCLIFALQFERDKKPKEGSDRGGNSTIGHTIGLEEVLSSLSTSEFQDEQVKFEDSKAQLG